MTRAEWDLIRVEGASGRAGQERGTGLPKKQAKASAAAGTLGPSIGNSQKGSNGTCKSGGAGAASF